MRFQARKVVKKGGDVEIRLSFILSEEEASNSVRISDDPNVTLDVHRLARDEDPGVRADQALMWSRILIHWVDIWNSRDRLGKHIMESVQKKQALGERNVSRNRKDKRVRNRRKPG